MKQPHGHQTIDWQRVRERLAAALAATDAAQQLSGERSREVLDSRAQALARVPASPPDTAETIEVLTLGLGEERYAIETRLVREVQREPEVTFVPGAPSFLRGIANLRGEILAVIDLGELFALGHIERDGYPWLIVLGSERPEFGVVCDSVHEILTLRTEALSDPSGSLNEVAREYASGVTSEATIVLDGEKLLGDPRLVVDQGDEPRG